MEGFPGPSCFGCSARIIDFKDRTFDSGLYTSAQIEGDPSGALNFYVGADTAFDVISYGSLFDLVLTRDGATNLVSGYLNGTQMRTFDDSAADAVFSETNNIAHFLMNDESFQDDPPLGFIDQLAIYDIALSANEVEEISVLGFQDGFESGDTSTWSSTAD